MIDEIMFFYKTMRLQWRNSFLGLQLFIYKSKKKSHQTRDLPFTQRLILRTRQKECSEDRVRYAQIRVRARVRDQSVAGKVIGTSKREPLYNKRDRVCKCP